MDTFRKKMLSDKSSLIIGLEKNLRGQNIIICSNIRSPDNDYDF